MSDQGNPIAAGARADTPTPPSDPAEREYVFRHTFLWRIESAEHREMFHQLGDVLYTLINEGGQWGSREDDRPIQVLELEAALLDLEAVGAALQDVADEPSHSEVPRESLPLYVMAADWAGAVSDLAHGIRYGIQDATGAPEPSKRGLGAELREAESIARRLAEHHPDPEARRIYRQLADRAAKKGRLS